MDKELQSDIIQWDVENWGKTLGFWQNGLSTIEDKNRARVLCLGERDGGISLWFGLQGFQAICSDIHKVTQQAQDLHLKYDVKKRIKYESIDIYHIPYPDNYFDVVACKSVIGGLKLHYKDSSTRTLKNQKKAIEEVRRVLKPGGLFMGAENMKGSLFHQWVRSLSKGQKLGWRHLQPIEVSWLFDSFNEINNKYYGFFGTFYRSQLLNTFFAWIDRLLSAILNPGWLYIGFIVAKK